MAMIDNSHFSRVACNIVMFGSYILLVLSSKLKNQQITNVKQSLKTIVFMSYNILFLQVLSCLIVSRY